MRAYEAELGIRSSSDFTPVNKGLLETVLLYFDFEAFFTPSQELCIHVRFHAVLMIVGLAVFIKMAAAATPCVQSWEDGGEVSPLTSQLRGLRCVGTSAEGSFD